MLLGRAGYLPHFIDEETDTQRGEVTSTVSALINDTVTSDWNQTFRFQGKALSSTSTTPGVGDQHDGGPPESKQQTAVEDRDTAAQRCPKGPPLVFNSPSMILLALSKPSRCHSLLPPVSPHQSLKSILRMVAEEKKPWRAAETPFLGKWMPT